jgi:hypothetical protein
MGLAAGTAARAEGKTIDQLATEALQRELARRTLNRLRSQGELRRRGMTDEQVKSAVEQAIAEVRER